jgi:hypothetical protein
LHREIGKNLEKEEESVSLGIRDKMEEFVLPSHSSGFLNILNHADQIIFYNVPKNEIEVG